MLDRKPLWALALLHLVLIAPLKAQIGNCPPTNGPLNCPVATAAPPISVNLCVPDQFPNDFYACPGQDTPAHYLVVPPACGEPPYPVVVLFRGTGSTQNPSSSGTCCIPAPFIHDDFHEKPYEDSDIMQEASRRGFFAISVLGIADNQLAFGVPQQIYGVERALEDFLSSCDENLVDRDRIFGLGFSMGGTGVLAYGARHLDPQADHGMFAGMVVLSGATSNSYRWSNVGNTLKNFIQQSLDLGTCSTPIDCSCSFSPEGAAPGAPLAYQQSCGVYTGCDLIVDPGEEDLSLAWNLLHIPIWGVLNSGDNANIANHMNNLDTVLTRQNHRNWNYGVGTGSCGHCWDIYQEFPNIFPDSTGQFPGPDLFDLLSGRTLTMPNNSWVLVTDNPDPDETRPRWHFHFQPTRIDSESLGRFHWRINASQNKLTLKGVSNLSSITVRTGTGGTHDSDLITTSPMTVKFNSLQQSLDVTLTDYNNPPQLVTRSTILPSGPPHPIQILVEGVHYFHQGTTLRLHQSASPTQTWTWKIVP